LSATVVCLAHRSDWKSRSLDTWRQRNCRQVWPASRDATCPSPRSLLTTSCTNAGNRSRRRTVRARLEPSRPVSSVCIPSALAAPICSNIWCSFRSKASVTLKQADRVFRLLRWLRNNPEPRATLLVPGPAPSGLPISPRSTAKLTRHNNNRRHPKGIIDAADFCELALHCDKAAFGSFAFGIVVTWCGDRQCSPPGTQTFRLATCALLLLRRNWA
jgi:hypothetical protein